jgi:hypothetical protein
MAEVRTVHFREPAPPLNGASKLATPRKEYLRPDISLLHSIAGASNQIREELKNIGDEATYEIGLRVLKTQGKLIADLADELLIRYGKAAE